MTRTFILAVCGLLLSTPVNATTDSPPSPHPATPQFGSSQPKKTNAVVSFRKDIIPLFTASCTMCHQGEIPMGALPLTPDLAYASLVGMPSSEIAMDRVAPGKPDKSYLYAKVSGRNAVVKGKGFGMPFGAMLAPADADLIKRWIAQGAKNN